MNRRWEWGLIVVAAKKLFPFCFFFKNLYLCGEEVASLDWYHWKLFFLPKGEIIPCPHGLQQTARRSGGGCQSWWLNGLQIGGQVLVRTRNHPPTLERLKFPHWCYQDLNISPCYQLCNSRTNWATPIPYDGFCCSLILWSSVLRRVSTTICLDDWPFALTFLLFLLFFFFVGVDGSFYFSFFFFPFEENIFSFCLDRYFLLQEII